MHDAVRDWVRQHMPEIVTSVAEFGSLDINGGVRDLLPPGVPYVGVDVQKGPGVTIVADAATWTPASKPPDLVLCLEVFEHCETWRDLVANAARVLVPGGVFICTAAGPGRAPHSARRESPPDADEWYENVGPWMLAEAMELAGFVDVAVDLSGADIRGVGRKVLP